MSKRAALFAIPVVLLATATWQSPAWLGFPLWRLPDALSVATGMAAKLACSGRFISGLDEARIIEDLASYSALNRRIELDFADNRASARLFGMAPASATWRPGIGCSLDIGDLATLDRLVAPGRAAGHATSALPWPRGDLTGDVEPAIQAVAESILQQDNAAGLETRALLMVRGGGIVAEAYADRFGAETPLLGWSMGKSVTAIMVGRMQHLGRLPADERTFDEGPLFPAWAGDDRRAIRLVDMLQMTSGLNWDETYAPGSDSTRILFQVASASDIAMLSTPAHRPGAHFYYSSGTTNLLARFVHDRLGGAQAQIDFFARELLEPLGMRHTYFEPDPSGVFVGSSYIYATARDWARLGLLMLNRGGFAGDTLLAPDWVDRAIAPNGSSNDPRYGYQFWLNAGGDALRWAALPADAYAMMGNRSQVVMVVPSADAVLVRLGWSSGRYPMEENFARLLQAGQLGSE
ncbi:MAG: serine hydrolase [Pseudomonadales bacterium]|nr:serine hydrolase [Pseudomonadales bacterium]